MSTDTIDRRLLANINFTSGTLPPGWIEQERQMTFEQNAIRSNGGAVLYTVLQDAAYREFSIEMEVEAINGAHLTFQDGSIAIIADLTNGRCRILHSGRRLLAEASCAIVSPGTSFRFAFDFDHGKISASVDGEVIISAVVPDGSPFTGHIDIGLWDDLLVREINLISGEEVEGARASAPKSTVEFGFEMTVDFVDDVIRSPWTEEMFQEMFARFQSWGVTRCQWIYYGKDSDGLWEFTERVEENIRKTFENVGDVLPAAVRAAHAHGIKIFPVLKPFDMGYNLSYGEGTEQARRCGKLQRIGGPVGWISDFIAENRQYLMARKPGADGPAVNEVFTRIDLVKEDTAEAGFSVDGIELFVSDDNVTYRPYAGAITRAEVIEDAPVWIHTSTGGARSGEHRPARIMRLSDLSIREKYFAIQIPSKAAAFSNTLINLVQVFGDAGRELKVTYGAETRVAECELNSYVLFTPIDPDFRKSGVEFDKVPGTPTACYPGYDAISSRFTLDQGEAFFAIARGKDRSPVAALSPSFPEAREWWLRLIEDCLDAGADGVELRVRNHHAPFAWAEYGFEKPVRDVFLARTGVDIWETDEFDRELHRRIRGEGYTEFCRAAKALVESRGRKLGFHISPTENMEPHLGGAMGIHFDWRTWIEEGIADSVTLKEVWPRTPLAEEVLALTRPLGVAAFFSPYANNIWLRPGGESMCDYWINIAKDNGFDGYQFYEGAAIVKAADESTLIVEPVEVEAVFRRHFVPGAA
jgi:hypothetical protein